MDIVLVILGFILCLVGIIGSFLPVLPGPFTAWVGLVVLYCTELLPFDWTLLGIALAVSLIVWALDYIVPIWGAKRFGGTKYGMIGSSIGLLAGIIFFPPFGIIIGPFVGAMIGELIKDASDTSKALKAAFGSFIGFLTGTLLKFTVAVVFTALYVKTVWDHWDAWF